MCKDFERRNDIKITRTAYSVVVVRVMHQKQSILIIFLKCEYIVFLSLFPSLVLFIIFLLFDFFINCSMFFLKITHILYFLFILLIMHINDDRFVRHKNFNKKQVNSSVFFSGYLRINFIIMHYRIHIIK